MFEVKKVKKVIKKVYLSIKYWIVKTDYYSTMFETHIIKKMKKGGYMCNMVSETLAFFFTQHDSWFKNSTSMWVSNHITKRHRRYRSWFSVLSVVNAELSETMLCFTGNCAHRSDAHPIGALDDGKKCRAIGSLRIFILSHIDQWRFEAAVRELAISHAATIVSRADVDVRDDRRIFDAQYWNHRNCHARLHGYFSSCFATLKISLPNARPSAAVRLFFFIWYSFVFLKRGNHLFRQFSIRGASNGYDQPDMHGRCVSFAVFHARLPP